jgi:cytochrome b subunit of formate dehydrogenase
VLAGVIYIIAALILWQPEATAAAATALDDASCLACHGADQKQIEVPVPDKDGEMRPMLMLERDKIVKGVHGEMTCITCHKEIIDSKAPHEKTDVPKPDCATCHEQLWETVKQQDLVEFKTRLGLVVKNIDAYRESYHAQPKGEKEHRAYCDDCHDTHYFNVPPLGTSKRTEWHLTIPKVCGEQCHDDSLEEYATSVHGKQVLQEHNPKAAVCTDCHTTHSITRIKDESFRQVITHQCGNCHDEKYATYRDTYHGQINNLGYTYTARCHDCHGYHEALGVDDPKSTINLKNRLETCQECHDGKKIPKATESFLSFSPHANTHDFKKYPQVWIAAKFMHGLLLFVFAYFWAHSLLWWYREYRRRKVGEHRPFICTDELLANKQVRRFGPMWRLAHLIFAISVMMLILTGMALYFSDSEWAPVVVKGLGGPEIAGLIHRISAAIMLGIFFVHLIAVSISIARKGKNFQWFGPDSLVPNWKDVKDAYAMFKWFFNKGERPVFDRWTYWEKFDYWAVFWGMAVIGGSGMMLSFPEVTAAIFPGWVFNVVMLVHGEEAFLAAVFLFTVHFFNNHFRPDKLPPPDIVMFTGTQSLEEFQREHRAQYDRLVETGQLEKYLVDAPSKPMCMGSKILGLVLISCGLGLLIIVGIGFFSR